MGTATPFRAVFAVSFLLVVFGLRAFELTAGTALTAAAGAMLLISLALYAAAALGRGAALAGAAVLCRLPWLAALPVLLYAALGLDERLTDAYHDCDGGLLPARYAGAAGYLLLIAARQPWAPRSNQTPEGRSSTTIRGLFIH